MLGYPTREYLELAFFQQLLLCLYGFISAELASYLKIITPLAFVSLHRCLTYLQHCLYAQLQTVTRCLACPGINA